MPFFRTLIRLLPYSLLAASATALPVVTVKAQAEEVIPDRLPRPEEYPYVEELPEVIRKVAPAYPAQARRDGVAGTVMVQALIGKDGRVKDTRILRSVPALDRAAVRAVSRWIFKPAKAHGEPVAVWVAVPVRFKLK